MSQPPPEEAEPVIPGPPPVPRESADQTVVGLGSAKDESRILNSRDALPPKTNAHPDWAFTLALVLLALLPRILIALVWAREPVWDGHYYHFGATRLAEGLGYSEDVVVGGVEVWKAWTHYPVGYSFVLSLFYRVFGAGLLVAPIVNAVTGALLVALTHRVARYALSQNRARVAGGLALLHPGLIAYSAVVMTEQTAALFLLAAGWAALALRHRLWGVVLAGALIGLGALIRPASLLALPLLLLVGGTGLWRGLLRTTLAGVVALLVISPWTLRNCERMDGCALISTNGGWNLAIGSLTTTGRFRTLRAEDGCPVVTGQVQQDRCWAEVGRKNISENPKRWLALMPLKLSQTFDHESFPIEYLKEGAPQLWPEARRVAGRELLSLYHWLLVAAAALFPLSLLTSMRRPVSTATQGVLLLATSAYIGHAFANPYNPFWPLVVMVPVLALLPFPGRPRLGPSGRYLVGLLFVTALTHAVFFGEDRYHLVISPVLCVLAAGALRRQAEPAEWAPLALLPPRKTAASRQDSSTG